MPSSVKTGRVKAAQTGQKVCNNQTPTATMSATGCLVQPPSPSSHFANECNMCHDSEVVRMDITDSMDAATLNKKTTTIIFDWDDTLLPSSWLSAKGLRLDFPAQVPGDVVAELESHQDVVCAVLTKACQSGTVIIITNAEAGWVELSARRFMPRVAPLLANICVFSARSTFESMYPDSPLDWKIAAFKQLVDQTRPAECDFGMHRSVISFGDSVHERDAVRRVTKDLSECFTKSVKFVERPNLEQLRREVDLVRNCLDYICESRSDLDLMLTIQLLYN